MRVCIVAVVWCEWAREGEWRVSGVAWHGLRFQARC